ncbi:MAG TPA: ATP-binding protein [Chitinophagaceae bacterium]|nr:ATP-binding protein [Chitinophagaceae bacterium]
MQPAFPPFLEGGGETGALIRSIDWKEHPLGPVDQWPPGLRTVLGMVLTSRFPMFLFWGPDLFCFYNDAYRPSLGKEGKHPQAMGQPGARVWAEIWPAIKPQIDQVMQGGQATWHEEQFLPIYRNNQLDDAYWTYSYSPVRDETGCVSGVLVTCQETTAWVRARRDMEEAYREKKQILDRISDGFFATDVQWQVTFWNSQVEKITGVTREVILGKNLWDVFSSAVGTAFHTTYLEAMRNQEPATIEAYFEPLNIWVEETVYPSPEGCSVYVRDVSARLQQEKSMQDLSEELRKKAADLQVRNEELEQFVYSVSHDLKEPLRMVNNFLHLLDSRYARQLDDRARQFIHFATDGASRMRILIDDLLEYSRASRLHPELTTVDTAALLQEIIRQQQPLIQELQGRLLLESVPVVRADRVRLAQVFQNLISNALKYQEPGNPPVIRIGAADRKMNWEFYVQDNGIGIETRYFDKIFQIFQRLHLREAYPGTGIGLALCRKIVEQHGGKIWVESEVGKGSTFYFTLPK